jgi:hypothetical protein
MRWVRSAASSGSIGWGAGRDGHTFGLGTRIVIAPSWRFRRHRIKQPSKPHQRAIVDHWPLGSPDTRANDFVEHPGREASSRVIAQFHIDEVALSAGATENLQIFTEQRVMWIENLCGL